MIGPLAPGTSFLTDALFASMPTLPGVELIDASGATAIAHSTSGIVYTGGTTFQKTLIAPSTPAFYKVMWDDNGGDPFPEVVWVAQAAVAVVAQATTVVTSTPSEFWIKQHDTREPITIQAVEDDGTGNQVPVDLTGVTESRFLMRLSGAGSPKVNDTTHVTITDATHGKCVYQWQTGDTDTVNVYSAEVQFTFSDSRILTVPTKGYLTVHVVADLGP